MKHVRPYRVGKTPKGKDLTLFVRFGGVDLKNQRGYGRDSFHAPPAPRGFYAMPKVIQEFFLLGSMDDYQPGTMPKAKNPYDHIEDPTDDECELSGKYWDEYRKRRRRNLSLMRKEFRKTEGNIWHHLGEHVPHNEIIASHGSWVKTPLKTWQKAFSKETINNRYGEHSVSRNTSLSQSRGLTGYYSRDKFEVFFDEKV